MCVCIRVYIYIAYRYVEQISDDARVVIYEHSHMCVCVSVSMPEAQTRHLPNGRMWLQQVIAKAEAATDLATCLGTLSVAISWALRNAKRLSMKFGCPIGPCCPHILGQLLGLVVYDV